MEGEGGDDASKRLRDLSEDTEHLIFIRTVRCIEEARDEHQVTKDKDTTTVVVALRLNVGVGHQEHGKDDRDDVPAGEDEAIQPVSKVGMKAIQATHVKVSATEPILSGEYQAENATIAGIWSKQTCRAYAEPISIL